ncbi:hypothetical protein [Teichococcus deserti]|uniref:hypothetical protein n=1 Tax=Teichococcus deserti TaxID=1817963 RepID=UPI001054C720|nr:hypothetical protein [Pseudoroseomonas deserti]
MRNSLPVQSRRILLVEPSYLVAMDLCQKLRRGGAIVLGPVPKVEQAQMMLARKDVEATLFSASLPGGEALAAQLAVWRSPSLLLSYVPLPAGHPIRSGRPQLVIPAEDEALLQAAGALFLPQDSSA